jgi:hypothetical protein
MGKKYYYLMSFCTYPMKISINQSIFLDPIYSSSFLLHARYAGVC